MNAFWIGIFLAIPIMVMILTLAMCKSAATADGNMELRRAADYNIHPITSDRFELNNEFKISSEEKTTPTFRQSEVHS